MCGLKLGYGVQAQVDSDSEVDSRLLMERVLVSFSGALHTGAGRGSHVHRDVPP